MAEDVMVTCSGCGEELPKSESWAEALDTPLGVTTSRVHRDRACVYAARRKLEGKPRKVRVEKMPKGSEL